MARSFHENGHQASILGRDPRFIEKARALGLPAQFNKVGLDYNPFTIAWFRRYFLDNAVDAVVVNIGKDMRSAGFAARLCGIPVIQHVGAMHDFRSTGKTRLDARLTRANFIYCSRFVMESMHAFAPHTQLYNGAAIHPGTMVPHTPRARRISGVRRIISTNNLHENKRLIDILKALVLLRAEGLDFHMTIAGEGEAREDLQRFVREQKLEPQVEFVGYAADVPALLEQADIFVLPTLVEGLGIALEEAMAHGLVPIARKAGGVPEIWPPFCEELLVRPEADEQDFAAVLRDLLTRPAEDMDALGLRIQEHARASFAQELQYQKFHDWVCTLLKQ